MLFPIVAFVATFKLFPCQGATSNWKMYLHRDQFRLEYLTDTTVPRPYFESEAFCQEKGGFLVEPRTAKEVSIVKELAKNLVAKHGSNAVWIGKVYC